MLKNTKLDLIQEPDNVADPFAIRVEYKGNLIGYIQKNKSHELNYYLNHPEQFYVNCRFAKKDNKIYHMMVVVWISVEAIDDENYVDYNDELFRKENAELFEREIQLIHEKIRKEKESRKNEQDRIQQIKSKKGKANGCVKVFVILIVVFLFFITLFMIVSMIP